MEFEVSGKTAAGFAAERSVNANTLNWWAGVFRRERREARAAEQSGFVEVASAHLPVPLPEAACVVASRAPEVTLRIGAGVVLVFGSLPSPGYVAAVAHSYDGQAS